MTQIQKSKGRSPGRRCLVRSIRLVALGLTFVGAVLSALLPLFEVGIKPPTAQALPRTVKHAADTGVIATRPAPTGIPHSLVFTYKENILETKSPAIYYRNVQHTIEQFRHLWGEPQAPVRFLDDPACRVAIQRSEPLLVPIFDNETEGKFKADMCRVADLYLNGGYYLDVDLNVVQPLHLDDDVIFSSVLDFSKQHFFQAFLASRAGHPILKKAFQIMLAYYEGRHQIRGVNMGTSTLKDAFDAVDQSDREASRLLIEMSNTDDNPQYYPDLPKQGNGMGPSCDQIVHDPEERKVYFYSKLIGSGNSCRDLTVVMEGKRGGYGSLLKKPLLARK